MGEGRAGRGGGWTRVLLMASCHWDIFTICGTFFEEKGEEEGVLSLYSNNVFKVILL